MNTLKALLEPVTLATMAFVIVLIVCGGLLAFGVRQWKTKKNAFDRGCGVAFAVTGFVVAPVFGWCLWLLWAHGSHENVRLIWLKAAMAAYPLEQQWWPALAISSTAVALGVALMSTALWLDERGVA
jgi:hypothetical protein